MQRVKNVDYDEDDLYSDEEDTYGDEEPAHSTEDQEQFAALTPVVRAELEESGLQASDKEIQDALWHYYWDVGKSVSYLKNTQAPKQSQTVKQEKAKTKPMSKFDEAAAKSAEIAGARIAPPMSAAEWFRDTPWTNVPSQMQGDLVPAEPRRPRPRLLGGSSKLAKLAEERRKRAAATADTPSSTLNGALNALDRLGKPKDTRENDLPLPKTERKQYPIRRKKEPSPPPREPTPPPVEATEEELPDLRASPTEFGRTLLTGPSHPYAASSMSLQDLFGDSAKTDPFQGPSPDDTVRHAQQNSNAKSKQATPNGLAKKTEALKLESTAPAQPKVKSKGLDVPKLWAEGKSEQRASAAFVVIGHVDHGKSTLMGRLLLDTGAVAQRDVDKYKKQAAELGKSSFALAWVMDTGSEERERGVTVDIAQHHFATDKVDFTILDAPGHRDFVPNMIGGASMADLAVLVVDANQLESGMKGQTREHILLARAVGLTKVIVAVNKLDSTSPAWSEDAFQSVNAGVTKLLKEAGFAEDCIVTIPCSGLSGENVVKAPSSKAAGWISKSHQTLLHALENSVPAEPGLESVKCPLRFQVADVFRGGVTNPLSVSGRISAGNVQVGDVVMLQPSGETAAIKGIEITGDSSDWAVDGQFRTLHLTDIDPQYIRTGDVLCAADKPVPVVKSFTAKVRALESLLPQSVDVHFGRLHAPGSIAQLVATMDAKGDTLKKKPRMVKEGQGALVKVRMDGSGIPVEAGNRVVLRVAGSTVSYGTVEPGG